MVPRVLSQEPEQRLQGMQQSHAVDQRDLRAARITGREQIAVLCAWIQYLLQLSAWIRSDVARCSRSWP